MLKNGFYNALGGIVRLGIGILSIPILIRLIGIEDYGVWTLASSIIGLATLAEGGISISTTFFLSKDIANDDEIGISETLTTTFAAMLVMATTAAIVFYFGSDFFVSFFHNLKNIYRVQLVLAFKFGSLVLWARLLQQHLIGIIQAYERYKLINILSTLQNTVGTLGLIAVALVGGRTIEMMKLQAIISVIALVIYLMASKRVVAYARPKFIWNKSKGVNIIKYSSVAWTGSLGSALFSQGDRLIVGSILDIRSLGIYAAVANIAGQINILSALAISPILPSITKYWTQKHDTNIVEIKKLLFQSLKINSAIAFGLGSLMILMSKEIVNIIAKNGVLANSVEFLQIAAGIYAIYSLNAVGYYILYAIGRTKICTFIHLLSAIVSLTLIFILSMYQGLLGSILGNCGYILTIYMTIFSLMLLNVEMKFLFQCWIFPVLWFLSTSLIALGFQNINEVFKSLIYMVEIFVLMTWVLKSKS